MTLNEFLDKVNWSKFTLTKRKMIRNTANMCPLQDVFGRSGYQIAASMQGLDNYGLIMSAADTGERSTWSLRKRMLRRIQKANPYAYNGPDL